MKQILITAMAATVILAPLAKADAQSPTSTTNSTDEMTALFGDPEVVKGTGIEIKRSELDRELTGVKSEAAARGEQLPPEQLTRIEAQMLEQLIDVKLLTQNANDADRADGAKKATDAMATLLKNSGSQANLDMQLNAIGSTEDQFRAEIAQKATAMAALQRILGVTVSSDDIQKFYNDHPSDFEQPEMVHVRHILLMTIDPSTRAPLADDVVKNKRKEADDILMKARSGEDFAKLAQEYSEDTMTKDKGGELPAFPHGQMLPEFEAAAFALTNNEISDVVTTMYGYHIIKFIDKTPAKKLTLTDTVPQTDVTISDRIKDVLLQQKTQELAPAYLEKLKKADNVQILDSDLNEAIEMLSDTNAVPPAGAVPAEK